MREAELIQGLWVRDTEFCSVFGAWRGGIDIGVKCGTGPRAGRRDGVGWQVLDMLRRTTPSLKAPIVLFTYYNPIMRRGLATFCRQAKEAGVAGSSPVRHWPPLLRC